MANHCLQHQHINVSEESITGSSKKRYTINCPDCGFEKTIEGSKNDFDKAIDLIYEGGHGAGSLSLKR